VRLAIQRLREDAQLPTRAHDNDAGMDLYAVEAATLAPGARAVVPTGIAVEIPERHAGLVLPRSGLAASHGITVVNAPGLIDAGYRGEIRVVMLNTDRESSFAVAVGDRIAQLVITRIESPDLVEVAELPPTRRAGGGFGSSGR
jgi:dUTP pyrophosphatase